MSDGSLHCLLLRIPSSIPPSSSHLLSAVTWIPFPNLQLPHLPHYKVGFEIGACSGSTTQQKEAHAHCRPNRCIASIVIAHR